ncbi:MAG: carbohydrate kinase family protein [Chloroflexi bacterium]|jgi:hypothetical protein|nr:carbohydrate kinase family protein [Chloroflexota bacterium]MBT3669718.1 carbohydrate kinase family protein [Chloroflexota bacterium]MBT4004115.1 carbohydrate kinase family protein [Chloroflexota bacterium]MBT4305198.1 carbohydrate kinase family protein [Chloroflexota bacterium]MBT4534879.1 carbohydrate kinase family protein [Chloroflexota bacterium]
MSLSPIYLLLGKFQREYLITPEKKHFIDIMGGNLLYAAGGSALWLEDKNEIGLVTRVGEDFPRTWITNLQNNNFNIEGINILPEELDLRSFRAYSDIRTSTTQDPIGHFAKLGITFPKSLLGYKDPNLNLDSSEILINISLRESDIPKNYQYANTAHLCAVDFMTHSLMPSVLRQLGITSITLDPGAGYMNPDFWDRLPSILPGLTAFLPSEGDIREFFKGKTEDIWEMIEMIGNWGAEIVVVKRGEKGQYIYDTAAKKKYEVPAYPSRMVDLTGAGDVFCGGFLVGYKKTFDPKEAVLHGNVAASFAVEGSGPFYANDVLPGLPQARLDRLRESIREV